MSPLLEVNDLRVSFKTKQGEVHAVDGVTFALERGETLGIVGESGSGKTVTALSILRLLDPEAVVAPGSEIRYAGRDLLLANPAELRAVRGAEIAMIFQEPSTSLNPVLSVGSQITETILAHRSVTKKAAKDRAVALLDLVGIPDPATRYGSYPHELSGGMQQRVMMAIALSCEPQVLIADEPTTALDVTIQAQVLDRLADLKRQFGMALLLISHDLGIVAGIADRVLVMYAGQVVEEASTRAIFASPEHPYTAALLAAIPRLDAPARRLAAIPGSVPPASAWPSGCRLHPRCPRAMTRCAIEAPPLFSLLNHRQSRCWLADVEPQAAP